MNGERERETDRMRAQGAKENDNRMETIKKWTDEKTSSSTLKNENNNNKNGSHARIYINTCIGTGTP